MHVVVCLSKVNTVSLEPVIFQWAIFEKWELSLGAEGDVAALLRSHMNSLLPFERTIEQTTETMLLALKQ